MRISRSPLVPLLLLLAPRVLGGCDAVPVDDQRLDKRLFIPRGVIRGAVTYVGPRPCSQDGHIVGSAVVLVFAANDPPPPEGVASSAQNFTVVPGDLLFPNEVRSTGPDLFCPSDTTTVSVTAPYVVSPLDAGEYVLAAFFDRNGRFLPTFKFRNLPEQGDLGGGYVDVADAEKNATNPGYSPRYLPVTVGTPAATATGGTTLVIPAEGYVADNVPVSIGSLLPYSRPYFYPEGADAPGGAAPTPGNPGGDPAYAPVVTMTQDHQLLAAPSNPTNVAAVAALQGSFTQTKLRFGVPAGELSAATDPAGPFGLPLSAPGAGLRVWSMGTTLPENPLIQAVWPLAVLSRLADDPAHARDPQSLVTAGGATAPIVIIQGVTLDDDSLFGTLAGAPAKSPLAPAALKDHVTVLVRPAALCLDARAPSAGGVLVTPHVTGPSADPAEQGQKALFDPAAIARANPLVRTMKQGCLPLGRYAMSLVYPTGQAWTTPNEMGSCAPLEGAFLPGAGATGSCAQKPRAVLRSQGTRAVLEIVPPTTPEGEQTCKDFPVPAECLGSP